MQTDKSGTILEAQWIENEIPRLEEELKALRKREQELLTTPLETVSRAYTDNYREHRGRAFHWVHRRRSVRPTRDGYRERMVDVGWLALAIRVLIAALVIRAVYVAYHNHQMGLTTKGVIWGSVLLVLAIGLAFVPPLADYFMERHARRAARQAAQEARQSQGFLREKQDGRVRLSQCQVRMAEVEERLGFARTRFDELRRGLTSQNHRGEGTE